jgi:adenine-specific DNA-methyltransferase
MPDVILWCEERGWLLLIEAVTSHGPIDPTRRAALERLFKSDLVGLVHVTAFPNRKLLSSYIAKLAWESEIWLADEPEHLIHLNGDRFLGPH